MKRFALGVLTASLAATIPAPADVIKTVPLTISNFHPVTTPPGQFLDDIVISLGARHYVPPPSTIPLPLPNEVLNNFRLTPADLGKTFTANAANDPQFADFAGLLTATDGQFFLSTTVFAASPDGSGNGAGSSIDARGTSFGGPSAFAGYQITAITERLDSLTITDNVTPDPRFPSIHGRQYSGQVTFTFEGTPDAAVPEPTTATLLTLATTALTLRRRPRRNA